MVKEKETEEQNEYTKPTRSKHQTRLGQKQNHIQKQLKIVKTSGGNKRYLREPHRLAKHNAMDCGKPNCFLCGNRRKLIGKTVQELKFEQTEKWNNYESETDKLLGTQ